MSKKLEEFNLIEKFFQPLTNSCEAAQNLSDDVAKISLKKDEQLIISKDLMVQGVHFLMSDGGFTIASKLLRSNLSDLASAGATPLHYLLGFSKNSKISEKFISEFAAGLKSVQDEFGLSLIGGDTVSAKQLFFSITIFGVAKKSKNLARGNAKDGDLIFVSGSIGDAYLGLQALNNKVEIADKKSLKYFLDRHFFPTPRINLGQRLLTKNISKCAIDVSDGLFADLKHICESSKLSAEIYQNKIPLSVEARKILQKNSKISVLDLSSAGDDYELIFTVEKKKAKEVEALGRELKLDLTCIGELKNSANKKFEISLFDEKNKKIKIKKYGYEH